MNLPTLLLCLLNISLFLTAPTSKDDRKSKIVKYENTNDGSGNYYFSYETSNGISRGETGTLVNAGQPGAHIEVRGFVSYLDPNGHLISLRYDADEKGYRTMTTDDFNLKPQLEFQAAVSPLIVASLLGGGG